MIQISNLIYCDERFEKMEIRNRILPNPYRDFPFLILKGFFSAELCATLVAFIKTNQDAQQAKVKQKSIDGIIQSKVETHYRKTNIYTLDNFYKTYYKERFLTFKTEIETFFNAVLTRSTDIQVLEYQEGDFYVRHADDSSALVDETGEIVGFRCVAPKRKFTTVLFATSHCDVAQENDVVFEGGELLFNSLFDHEGKMITLTPQAGDMIIFPSNPYFSHQVATVTKGYRLTLVQWHDAIV